MQEVNIASWNTCVFNLKEADVLIVWFAFQGGEPQKERKKEEIHQFRNCKSFLTILVKGTDQKRHNRLNSLHGTEIISEWDLRHLATHNKGVGWKHCLPRRVVLENRVGGLAWALLVSATGGWGAVLADLSIQWNSVQWIQQRPSSGLHSSVIPKPDLGGHYSHWWNLKYQSWGW